MHLLADWLTDPLQLGVTALGTTAMARIGWASARHGRTVHAPTAGGGTAPQVHSEAVRLREQLLQQKLEGSATDRQCLMLREQVAYLERVAKELQSMLSRYEQEELRERHGLEQQRQEAAAQVLPACSAAGLLGAGSMLRRWSGAMRVDRNQPCGQAPHGGCAPLWLPLQGGRHRLS
jgi:hypothetical protein